MNYNPYAPPQAAPPPGGPFAYGGQGTGLQPWAVGEVIGIAFESFKTHWPVLLGTLLVFALCISPVVVALMVLPMLGVLDGIILRLVQLISELVLFVVEAYLLGGFYRVYLKVARNQPTSVGELHRR